MDMRDMITSSIARAIRGSARAGMVAFVPVALLALAACGGDDSNATAEEGESAMRTPRLSSSPSACATTVSTCQTRVLGKTVSLTPSIRSLVDTIRQPYRRRWIPVVTSFRRTRGERRTGKTTRPCWHWPIVCASKVWMCRTTCSRTKALGDIDPDQLRAALDECREVLSGIAP
jgi:hypothetical protein